jgi:signal transduction histidine kinase
VPRPFTLNADRAEFERIAMNLLRNAAQSGAKTVTVSAARPLPSGMAGAVIDVVDDGPGLPQDVRQRLFEPFAAGRKGGTGLGLAIVRDLVHAHSGSVQLVDTAPGAVAEAGAHFRIELPRA